MILPKNKRIAIIGGGTVSYISNHLALSAPAYGSSAKKLEKLFQQHPENKMEVDTYLTKMADPSNNKKKNLERHLSLLKKKLGYLTAKKKCTKETVEKIHKLEEDLLRASVLETPEDVSKLVDTLVADPTTRVIIFNVAMVDYKPERLYTQVESDYELSQQHVTNDFGKYTTRLNTRQFPELHLELSIQEKIIQKIRKERKDILLVGFKTTCGATKEEQFKKGLKLCKDASANIVFVNDVDKNRILELNSALASLSLLEHKESSCEKSSNYIAEGIRKTTDLVEALQNNGLVTPEESSYWYNTRDEALDALVQMVLDRSHLHFTRSTVVDSETVPWNVRKIPETIYTTPAIVESKKREYIPNPIIPNTFRTVFDWVRSQGAYKQGPTGATVGHMGIKLSPHEFLTTKRKTDFNKMEKVGLVRVITDDPDNVFGYKHYFRPQSLREYQEYLEFVDNILENAKPAGIVSGWLGANAEYWALLKIYPDLSLKTLEDFAIAKERLEGFALNDKVIAFGAKPSVGGQSQRSLFDTFPELDCIVHFHCPLKVSSRDLFNTTPQFSYECGSKECIASNITGFKEYKVSDTHSIWAGHMIKHGPNIVFNSSIDPQLVIDFIETHWDLSRKTDGLSNENQ